ncbi:hypothetical protein ACRAWF_16355 [Streptomyces sp. L7]
MAFLPLRRGPADPGLPPRPGPGPPETDGPRPIRPRGGINCGTLAAHGSAEGPRTTAVTSRTFSRLARLCGAAPGRQGPFVERRLVRLELRVGLDRLVARSRRPNGPPLPGVSAPRAAQSLAGAVVGHTVMKLTGIKSVTVCPWGIREGILLRVHRGRRFVVDRADPP